MKVSIARVVPSALPGSQDNATFVNNCVCGTFSGIPSPGIHIQAHKVR